LPVGCCRARISLWRVRGFLEEAYRRRQSLGTGSGYAGMAPFVAAALSSVGTAAAHSLGKQLEESGAAANPAAPLNQEVRNGNGRSCNGSARESDAFRGD